MRNRTVLDWAGIQVASESLAGNTLQAVRLPDFYSAHAFASGKILHLSFRSAILVGENVPER